MNLRTTILALAIAAFAAHSWADGKLDARPKLRFAQITDMHLFDAGYNCYAPDVDIEQDSAINGLKWAVDQINQENQVAALNFVVITGDIGIANLANGKIPPHNLSIGDACSQNPSTPKELGPVKSESIQQAAINFACILRELKVRSIYLVPGENDVVPAPPGRESYREFVQALSRELPGRIRDLSGIVDPASDAPWDVVQGYRLIGFDSASFNPSDAELNKSVPEAPLGGKPAPTPPPCRDPDPRSANSQVSRTAKLAAKTSGPFLLFTHIPDLEDPYDGRQVNPTTGKEEACSLTSSWMLAHDLEENQDPEKEPTSRQDWAGILTNQNLVGVFVGHVHSPDASQYGGPFFPVSTKQEKQVQGSGPVEPPTAVRKIYVAPPISRKDQWNTPNPRRGLLIIEVQGTLVNAKIDWYGGIDPTEFQKEKFAGGAQTFPATKTWFKYLLLYGIVALLLFVWDFASYARWPKLRTTPPEIRLNLDAGHHPAASGAQPPPEPT
jgi:hypothetical protein